MTCVNAVYLLHLVKKQFPGRIHKNQKELYKKVFEPWRINRKVTKPKKYKILETLNMKQENQNMKLMKYVLSNLQHVGLILSSDLTTS